MQFLGFCSGTPGRATLDLVYLERTSQYDDGINCIHRQTAYRKSHSMLIMTQSNQDSMEICSALSLAQL